MFERFTERARQVVLLTEDEARGLGHDYIGTEHVLLGLVRLDEGVAARILLDFDADARQVRSEVLQAIGPTPRAGPPRTERHRPPPVPDLRRADWSTESTASRVRTSSPGNG